MRTPLVFISTLCAISIALAGLMPASAAPASAKPCTGVAYHQFDFFLGDWNVVDTTGKPLGKDRVTEGLGGCVQFERWSDAMDAGGGFGITGYRPGIARWHQTFMDDTGLVLALDGAPGAASSGALMALSGIDYSASGAKRAHRVVWSKHGAIVEEHWQMSKDGGHTWQTVFDGFFHRA